ncbi:MAG: fumarylacetoacetate hydrolase family protein [Gemmatimonadetes bacterium]|nr:fumarylacetoacetate hydrolase family protein [Gemmatimonadota bacterium]
MKRLILAAVLAAGCTSAEPPTPSTTPFKLGTFELGGTHFVGVVLDDSVVIDLAAADLVVGTSGERVAAPADMKDLIVRYDQGVRTRIQEIVGSVESTESRPGYVHSLTALKTLPPIMYPTNMVNTALNYREHALEMAGLESGPPALVAGAPPPGFATPTTTSSPGIWERAADDNRWNPYMFLKASSSVIADGEAVLLPVGRDRIDSECELGAVIGRAASRVPLAEANDYIFGYTIELDVSDRGGRGDERYGSDWLITKSHDTFGPLGPFIVPKEFVGDPRNLAVQYVINGALFQEANTALMIHDVFDQVVYASNILTLRPGDVIATGSPAGVGSARNPPIFLKPGDISVCTYEGVGTLTNPIETASGR